MKKKENFTDKEKAYLKRVSSTYTMAGSEYSRIKREFAIRSYRPFIQSDAYGAPKGSILQLGCADGLETQLLLGLGASIDVIDGSDIFITECKKNYHEKVRYIHTLFEEYTLSDSQKKYDYVFASWVLEHVFDVQTILTMIKRVLNPFGMVFVTVPNAKAASRQLALHMNLIPHLKDLTENDKNHGHRRVYDRFSINTDLENGGFEIVAQGGIIFKLLADFQLDQLLTDGFLTREHMEGLYQLGLEYPDFCDSLYTVCRIKQSRHSPHGTDTILK
ncbi:MAG: class I SAM-dependent methyltransferase [Anaerohalosphaeraceae bacterium]|jgi:2-polyprenyl-3-methyl-5-hydroxy-6-metoxy-1,4-benzoquinol methylase